MNKAAFFIFCTFFGSIAANKQSAVEQPTLEQLMESNTIIITYKYRKSDEKNFDREHWKTAATRFNALIDLCHAVPKGKNDAVFQEIYKILEIVRPKDGAEPQKGLQGNLEIIITSEENLSKPKENIDS